MSIIYPKPTEAEQELYHRIGQASPYDAVRIMAESLRAAEKRGAEQMRERAAKEAVDGKYLMFLTHGDVVRGPEENDRVVKIRSQARAEVAKAIRALPCVIE